MFSTSFLLIVAYFLRFHGNKRFWIFNPTHSRGILFSILSDILIFKRRPPSAILTEITSINLKRDSYVPKTVLLLQWKPFKNNEKCFLYHLKSPFRSQDILIFVLNFWPFRKKGLIKKDKFNFKIYDITVWLTNN